MGREAEGSVCNGLGGGYGKHNERAAGSEVEVRVVQRTAHTFACGTC